MARKKINRFVRIKIFERDNYSCLKCGISANKPHKQYDGKNTLFCNNNRWLELDHIIPLSKNGIDDFSNLQTLCNICNCKKGASYG